MDIDDILKRAETHHTQETSQEADELLSQFKVVSVDNMEDEELERYDAGACLNILPICSLSFASTVCTEMPRGIAGKEWDDIIPEEERRKVTEEEIQKELMALNLPPRQRKQITKVRLTFNFTPNDGYPSESTRFPPSAREPCAGQSFEMKRLKQTSRTAACTRNLCELLSSFGQLFVALHETVAVCCLSRDTNEVLKKCRC